MAWNPYVEEEGPHRSQERRRGNPIDDALRRALFEIKDRDGNAEPVWRRRDKSGHWREYLQHVALAMADAEAIDVVRRKEKAVKL